MVAVFSHLSPCTTGRSRNSIHFLLLFSDYFPFSLKVSLFFTGTFIYWLLHHLLMFLNDVIYLLIFIFLKSSLLFVLGNFYICKDSLALQFPEICYSSSEVLNSPSLSCTPLQSSPNPEPPMQWPLATFEHLKCGWPRDVNVKYVSYFKDQTLQ